MAINFLQLPGYNPGGPIDFSPINNALNSLQQQNQFNAQNKLAQAGMDLQRQRFDLDKQRHSSDMDDRERQREKAEAKDWAAFYNHVKTNVPPEQQQAVWASRFDSPRFRKQQIPDEVRNFATAGPRLQAAAAGYMSPMELAELGFKQAQTFKAYNEGSVAADDQSKVGQVMQLPDGSFVFVQGSRRGPPRMYPLQMGGRSLPQQPSSGPPPPQNMLAPYAGQAGGSAPPAAAPYAVPPPALPRPNQVNPAAPPPGRAYAPPRYVNPPGIGLDERRSGVPSTSGAAPPNYSVATPPQPLVPYRDRKIIGGQVWNPATGQFEGSAEDAVRGGEYVKEDAKAAVGEVKARNEAIQVSRSKLPRLEIMEQLIARPEVYQGTGGNAVLELRKAAQALGFDVGDLSGSEAVRMISNQFALALRNPAGGEGMPGALSDRDLSFLVSSTPGLANTRQGNALMVRVMIELERHKMKENAEIARYLQQKRSQTGLADHMQGWAQRNSALTEQTRKRITGLTGVQYGAMSGPTDGSPVPKQYGGRLNEPEVGTPSPRGASSFAAPGLVGNMPSIRNDSDYEALPPGSAFIAPDGSWRRKP